jgi:hypothetical protein
MTPDERPRRPRSPVVAAAILAVFVVAVVATIAQPLLARDVAADRFVTALAASRALVHPGDTVLVHPPWRDDVVAAVRAGGVVPASTTVTEAFAPRHGDPLPPLVVIADAAWTLPAVLATVKPGDVVEHDGVIVFRLDGGPSTRADVADSADGADVARATVHVEAADGNHVACPWDAARRRHVCTGLPEWMTVGDDTLVIGGQRERCTWAHPTTNGVVVVDFGTVPTARSGWRLSVALTDPAADNPAGAPVTATLVVDDDTSSVTVQHERGFHDVVVAGGDRTNARVLVRLTTPNDGQRHTCFRLQPASGRAP